MSPCPVLSRVLNDELEKEGEGLVANRGFITTYQDNKKLNDNQLFLIYLTDAVRKQYEQKMLRQAEQVCAFADRYCCAIHSVSNAIIVAFGLV